MKKPPFVTRSPDSPMCLCAQWMDSQPLMRSQHFLLLGLGEGVTQRMALTKGYANFSTKPIGCSDAAAMDHIVCVIVLTMHTQAYITS